MLTKFLSICCLLYLSSNIKGKSFLIFSIIIVKILSIATEGNCQICQLKEFLGRLLLKTAQDKCFFTKQIKWKGVLNDKCDNILEALQIRFSSCEFREFFELLSEVTQNFDIFYQMSVIIFELILYNIFLLKMFFFEVIVRFFRPEGHVTMHNFFEAIMK